MFEDEMGNNNKKTKTEAANESFEEVEDDDDIELIMHEEETPIFVRRGRGKDDKSEESEAISNHEMAVVEKVIEEEDVRELFSESDNDAEFYAFEESEMSPNTRRETLRIQ